MFTARDGLCLCIHFRLILAIVDFSLTITFVFIYMLLSQGQRGEAWGPSKERRAFGNEVTLYRKSTSNSLYKVEVVFEKTVFSTDFISRSIARSKQNQINRIIVSTVLATPITIGQSVVASVVWALFMCKTTVVFIKALTFVKITVWNLLDARIKFLNTCTKDIERATLAPS